MYTNVTEIAAQYVADLHREAAEARLAREAARGRADRHPQSGLRRLWSRRTMRRACAATA